MLLPLLLLLAVNLTNGDVQQLPHCKDQPSVVPETPESSRSLIFVSTLDGKLTALDAAKNGEKRWSLDWNEELLSSSIHRRDLNSNGQWVRLIPSLNGGLYKFDGKNLEAVPVTVDQLLKSSYRYSDNLIFSGGKETRTYGISSATGKVIYECIMRSCIDANNKEEKQEDEDVLVVQRHQHIVRAGEPKTGIERWNFSVGLHDLSIIPKSNSNCNLSSTFNLTIDLRAVVPDGLLTAYKDKNSTIKLWEYKFDAPIVSVWKEDQVIDNGELTQLKELNLFDSVPANPVLDPNYTSNPGLYIGMYAKQLYIQENPYINEHLDAFSKSLVKYPWRPYPVLDKDGSWKNIVYKKPNDVDSTTALSVLYNTEYVNGNGYYLYPRKKIPFAKDNKFNKTERVIRPAKKPSLIDEEIDDTQVQVIIVSLWYWWREIAIISITSALLLNYYITHKYLNEKETKNAVPPPFSYEFHVVNSTEQPRKSVSEDSENFQSRYLTDYQPVACLGKGGYGVVFEAKNKIDDCNYAIKRIALPNSQSSRERVMREVKALAKLEHHNIVRYFNSWLECPPPKWVEDHDREWCKKNDFTASDITADSTAVDSSQNIDALSSDTVSVDSAWEALDMNAYENTSPRSDNKRKNVVKKGGENEREKTEPESEKSEDSESVVFEHSVGHKWESNTNDLDDSDESVVFQNSIGHKSESTIDDPEDSEQSIVFRNSGGDESISMSNKSENSESIVFANSAGKDSESKRSKSGYSDSIVFAESHNGKPEATEESIVFENSKSKKSSLSERKSQLNVNLRKRKDSYKSNPKMFLYIQMQLCQRLSLREWLKANKTRNISQILNMFLQIIDAVEYVHLQGLIHRDLKPSNIFFALNDKIKIGDFGLVTAMLEGIGADQTQCNTSTGELKIFKKHTAQVGTTLYMSPEQMNGDHYNYKVDIYSLGIILFELLIPFDTEMERVVALSNLRKSIYPDGFATKYPEEYKLLKLMLDSNPERRPTTLGIRARPPLVNKSQILTSQSTDDNTSADWHFELPLMTRNLSTSNTTSGSDTTDNVS
ncbi:hypothetical protein TKK_0003807 [Trichogramma kaykai]|uniref:non-specific serine/threonine protein kinase n=1 Tax=Trichogramma kaykai TaxID=54128 RepID=A0ABD2XPU0_9HYME